MSWNLQYVSREAFEADRPVYPLFPPKPIIEEKRVPEEQQDEQIEAAFVAGTLPEEDRRAPVVPAVVDRPDGLPPRTVEEDVCEQVAVARRAVEVMIESGAIGPATMDFSVNISGHANLNHLPASGWANDCITINIYQKSPVIPG